MPAPGFFIYDRLDSLSDVTPVTVDERVLTRDNDTGKYLGRDVPQTAALIGAGGSDLIGFQQSGTGAVLRTVDDKLKDEVSVTDYGAVGDGVTDNVAAFNFALTAAAPIASSRGRRVKVPFGVYRLSQSLHITRNVVLVGEAGSGNTAAAASYSGSTLLFDAGVTGIIVDRATTAPDGGRGDYSSIKDVSIQAAGKTTPAHGIQMHARASIEHCWIKNFASNGIHIVATIPTNANNWHVADSRVEDCSGWGLYVQGNDVNAGYAIGLDISLCGDGGIHDESFLGNLYSACHVDTCNGPPYETVGSVNQSLFERCYAEDGQPIASKIRQPSVILGGNMEFDPATTAPYLRAYANRAFLVKNAVASRNDRGTYSIETHLGYDDTAQKSFGVQRWTGGTLHDEYFLQYDGEEAGWFSFMRNGLQAQAAWAVSSVAAPEGPGNFRVRNGLYLGSGVNKRVVRQVTARPSLGEGLPGDVAVNITTTLGGPALYVGVFNGTTTQWQDAAIIAPFDTAHTWNALQTFGAGAQFGVQRASWAAANEAPPSAVDDSSGTRLLLAPGGTFQSSYKLGLEPGAMWFNSDSAFKWYRQTGLLATLDNTGLALAAGKTLVAPGGATINNITGIVRADAGVLSIDPMTGFLGITGSEFARVFSGGSQPFGDVIWESTSDDDKGSQYWGSTRFKESSGQWGFGTYEIPAGLRAIFDGDVRIAGRLLVGEEDSEADFLISSDPEPATTFGTFSIGAGGFSAVGPVFNGPAAGTVFAANHLTAFGAAGGHFINLQQEGTSRWVVRADGKQGYGTAEPLDALHVVGGTIRMEGAQALLEVPQDTGAVGAVAGRVRLRWPNGTVQWLLTYADTAPPPAAPGDDFNAANVASINTRVSSSLHTWTEWDGSPFEIISNQLHPTTRPRAMNVCTLSGQVASGAGPVKVTMFKVTNFARFAGIMVHVVDAGVNLVTGYIVGPGSDFQTLRLDYWNGGAFRNEADTGAGPIATGGVMPDAGELAVYLGATTLEVRINGSSVIGPVTIGHNLASAVHGLFIEQGSNPDGTHDTLFDNFVGEHRVMADRFISPTATSGDGTLGNPWGVAQFNANCAYGDRNYFRGGIYKTLISFGAGRPSGTPSDSNRLLLKNYGPDQSLPAEVPLWDGSRLSVAKLVAVPDPWAEADVPRETGWDLANGTGTLSNVGSGSNIYRKTFSPSTAVFGVFIDKFDTTDGPGGVTAAGRFSTAWDMGRYLMADYTSPDGKTFNPVDPSNVGAGGYIHAGGAVTSGPTAHTDIFRSSFSNGDQLAHGVESQFKDNGGGQVDLRLYGAPWDPDDATHKVYFQVSPVECVHLDGKGFITFDGLRFYRWKRIFWLNNCPNTIIQNCWLMHMWGYGNQALGCANFKLLNNTIYGGGSQVAHVEGAFEFNNCQTPIIQGNHVAWAGHDAIFIRGGNNGKFLENHVHHTAGTMLAFDTNTRPSGWEIARNRFHSGNKQADVSLHKHGHGALQVSRMENSSVDDNLIYDVGFGFFISGPNGAEDGVFSNKFRGNTIDNTEWYNVYFQNYAPGNNKIANNLFTNNIFSNPGGPHCINVPVTGDQANFCGNVWRKNLFYRAGGNHVRILRQSNTSPFSIIEPANGNPYVGTASAAPAANFSGNIEGNPAYTHPTPDTYNITAASPAYNTGSASPITDMSPTRDGIRVGLPDMGYFEVGAGGGDIQAPTISASNATPTAGNVPLTVNFSVTASDASTPLVYEWIFGDGASSALQNPSHIYTVAGNWTARLRVRDNAGNWTNPIEWTIQAIPVPDNSVQLILYGVSASAEAAGQPASMATDGTLGSVDSGNYWAAGPMPQSIRFDLRPAPSARKRVTRFDISVRDWTTRIYTMDLQVADVDGPPLDTEWLTIAPDVVNSVAEFTTFNVPETTAGWARILVKSLTGSTSTFAALHEVRIWGKDVPAGQPGAEYTDFVWSDSVATTGAFAPSKVADNRDVTFGDPLSRWIGNPLPVDLIGSAPNLRALGKVVIQPDGGFDGRTYTVRVDTSADDTPTPTTWATQVPAVNTATGRETTYSFTPVTCRHVRVTFSAASDGIAAAKVWRVQLYAS